ncbi:MAG: hypothetical protein RIS75_810 [Actinomycetota bacterium]
MTHSVAFTNIGSLITNDPTIGDGDLGEIKNAAIIVEDGKVAWVGSSSDVGSADAHHDLDGRTVIPGFVDSHAHLLFAGDRSEEFSSRMTGAAYSAGGIRSTVERTRLATDDQLRSNYLRLISEMHRSGITTFETKTGYGLTLNDEIRCLEIAAEQTSETTLLAAHVVPAEYADQPDAYVDLIINEMLPAALGKARWVDVFCDRGAFTPDQTDRILTAAAATGFELRLHANQLQAGSGISLGVKHGVASVDHCTYASDEDLDQLASSNTVATLLPGAEFSTRATYPSGRRFVDAGVKVAIATDCNPGSSYTTSMPFCIAVAVRDMRLSPAEALLAATRGGAAALRRTDVGHLGIGAQANFVSLNAPSYIHLAYRPGVDLISQTFINGISVLTSHSHQEQQ